jgi:hypothetical protein
MNCGAPIWERAAALPQTAKGRAEAEMHKDFAAIVAITAATTLWWNQTKIEGPRSAITKTSDGDPCRDPVRNGATNPPPPAPDAPPSGQATSEYFEWETTEPARVETRSIPPVYKTITVTVVVRPAYTRQYYYIDRGFPQIAQELVPADVRYERRKVLIQAGREQTVEIPAQRRLVRKTKLIPLSPQF